MNGLYKTPLIVHTSYGGKEIYDVEYFFRDFEEMPDIEQYALSFCAGRVLDIGAGAGSHSLYLQEEGFDVTALDISSGCLNIMLARGIQKVLNTDFFILHDGGYNTLLLLMNGIGISGNLEGMVRFLQLAEKITASRAQIIFDTTDVGGSIGKDPGDKRYVGELKYRFEYKGKRSAWFGWLYIDAQKLIEICEETAWMPQVMYENTAGQYLARLLKKY
jgi:hypothetical protein